MDRPFDSWRTIALSLYMVLTGYAVLVGIPVISTAWVEALGFSAVEVGRLAAADLGGFSLGAVICAVVIARCDRRRLVLGAALLAILANLGCVGTADYPQVLLLRLLAGLGSGIYTATAVAALAATSNPTRAYGWALLAFAFSQALELSLLPLLSMAGVYLVFAGSYALVLPLLSWLPSHAEASAPLVAPAPRPAVPPAVPWLVLAAIFATYVNIGAYWTYVELASRSAGASSEWVGRVLVASSLFSILGCITASMLSRRFGLARPLLLTLVAQAAVVLVLAGGITDTAVAVSVLGFSFLWMCADIYQLSTVAEVDPSGRFAALVPGAQGLGQIIGPGLASVMLAGGLGYSAVFAMCAAASLAALAIYLGLAVLQRHTAPAHAS